MNETIIRLGGGLNTADGPIKMSPGELIGSENYEPKLEGGYQRVKGCERYDGRPKPSDAVFVMLKAAAGWHADAIVGATLEGATSAATGVICYASGLLRAVTKVTGTFTEGEDVKVGVTTVGTDIVLEPSISASTENTIYAAAADIYRADIEEVPGEGPICGVCVVDNVVYAFRNNVGSTKQEVWQATSSGWQPITYPTVYRVYFDSGNGGSDVGAFFLTQGGVTATVHRVMRYEGSFAGGDAKGVLVLRGAPTGGSLITGIATIAGLGTVNLTTVAAEVTLAPNGKWTFVPYQFDDQYFSMTPGALPVYGVDRVERAGLADGGGNCIEFDGYMAVPLNAGGVDGPWRIACHKQHLFVVQRHVGIVHSGIGNPYDFTTIAGGGEIEVGDKVTALEPLQGSQNEGALAILCSNRTNILYGNDAEDWQLVNLSDSVGAKAYSTQTITTLIGMDEQGVRTYVPGQNFGNFSYNTITDHIRRKVTGKTPVASVIDRAEGHYRLFFDDGTWLSGMPGRRWAWGFGAYPFQVSCAVEFEIQGVSTIFMGTEDGYVMQADVGRSFDGEDITAWMKTAYAHMGSPNMRKAFRTLFVEIRGDSVGSIYVQPDYQYGETEIDEQDDALAVNAPILGTDGAFDLGDWDAGSWDAKYQSNLRVRASGVGENVSTLIYSQSAVELAHEITALMWRYTPRRPLR